MRVPLAVGLNDGAADVLAQVPLLRLRSTCTVWPASEIGRTEPLRPSFAGCVAEKTIFGATFTATGEEFAAEEWSR